MADQDPIPTNGNGEEGELPQASTLAQYIKDLSVENPSSPQVFQWNEQPQLDVQFAINVNRASDDVHEVVLKIEASARSQSGVHFMVDLSYAGLFGLRNVPEGAMGPILLAEAPRLLFPFARQVVANAVQDCGFPPLLLDPIDFGALYVQQMAAAGEQDGDGGALPPTGDEPTVQ